jgi:mono/diheme cytochrome c family protein
VNLAFRTLRVACCIVACGVAVVPAAQPGESIYKTYCALCHQQGAEGLAGQFPRLKGRLQVMLAQPSSRRYAIQVVLNGMAGGIEVDHSHIVGVMPPLGTFSDRDVAAVLSYVAGLEGKEHLKPVTEAEVSQVRAQPPLSATDMHALREKLVQAGGLP